MLNNRIPTAAAALAVLLLSTGCTDADGGADRSRRESPGPGPAAAASDTVLSPGGRLTDELGCGACHADLPDAAAARKRAPAFGDAGRSYEPGFLLSYLQSPGRVRTDIGRTRMPDFHLTEGESLALSLFLLETSGWSGSPGSEFRRAREAHPAADAELGRRIFRGLNCAGCHRGTGVERWSAGPPLAGEGRRARAEWLKAWLAEPTALRPFGFHPGTGSRMPDFRLTDAEVDTLARYLRGRGTADAGSSRRDSTSRAAPTLTAFERQKAEAFLRDRHSCLGCHRLDGRGGRIGPPLDDVPARRPDRYLRRVVAHPDSAAPGTVMPRITMTAERRRLLIGYLAGPGSRSSGDTAAKGGPEGTERSGYLSLVEHPLRAPTRRERAGGAGAGDRSTAGTLYRERCASCHGTRGSGDGYNARYLPTGPAVHASTDSMARRPDDVLFDGVWAGGRVLEKSHRMPPFGGSLTREQAWSLVEHIRELCDCRGAEWSREER